ncbi:glutathione S-transferase [Francisellaceae bacterium CB299]|jgi:glutathione S-transferase
MTLRNLPVLYTFRRCPYAIRARMAIFAADIVVDLQEVSLRDKPQSMLAASSKGTVPVLCVDSKVIDESIDIMRCALAINDPNKWLDMSSAQNALFDELLQENDSVFKRWLDKYKYANRFPEYTEEYYRNKAEEFIVRLESILQGSEYLLSDTLKIADIAIFPFIRQFSMVDKAWFDNSQYTRVKDWLATILALPLFVDVMRKR